MGLVKLEKLGIRLRLHSCFKYICHGAVEDVPSLDRKLHEENAFLNQFDEGLYQRNHVYGRCLSFLKIDLQNVQCPVIRDIHVFWAEALSPLYDPFVRGHEETHALIYMKRLKSLQRELKRYGAKNSERILILGDEDVADCGGLFALFRELGKEGYYAKKDDFRKERKIGIDLDLFR